MRLFANLVFCYAEEWTTHSCESIKISVCSNKIKFLHNSVCLLSVTSTWYRNVHLENCACVFLSCFLTYPLTAHFPFLGNKVYAIAQSGFLFFLLLQAAFKSLVQCNRCCCREKGSEDYLASYCHKTQKLKIDMFNVSVKGKDRQKRVVTFCRRHLARHSACVEPQDSWSISLCWVGELGWLWWVGPHTGWCGTRLLLAVKERMTVHAQVCGLVSQAQLGLYVFKKCLPSCLIFRDATDSAI